MAESGGGAASFAVTDSSFVHLGIGQSVAPTLSGASASHPLRRTTRELVPTTWTVRGSDIAELTGSNLRGLREGQTWLIWSRSGVVDSVPLVVSAPPVAYLEPRVAMLTASERRVSLRSMGTDSVTFCQPIAPEVGLTLSGVAEVDASRAVTHAVRCRTRAGRTAAAFIDASAFRTPPADPEPLPPGPTSRRVDLKLYLFGQGPTPSVVNNGIPLPQGWASAQSLDSVRLVADGRELPIRVVALKGRHHDGSLRAVRLQARIADLVAAQRVELQVGAHRLQHLVSSEAAVSFQPAAALLPADVQFLLSTGGFDPTLAASESAQIGADFTRYEQNFVQFEAYHWNLHGDSWGQNEYDRGLAYFTFWMRTGNSVYWHRGARLVERYIRDYLIRANYCPAEWNTHLDGLLLHYWATGDTLSGNAIPRTAECLARMFGGAQLSEMETHPYMDNRIQTKVLSAKVLAIRLDASPTTAIPDWRAAARQDLDYILAVQRADGSYRSRSQCGHSSNFMSALLSSALIAYHDYVAQDPRIPNAVRANLMFMRNSQWRTTEQVFHYYSGDCPPNGSMSPGDDLNGLFLHAIGWIGRRDRDATWFTFGDLVLRGALNRTWFQGPKQFNQTYYSSWRYSWDRQNR